ncbi:MAG TPA: hypothetical protein VMU19_11170 [Bryobacteraceae bacterium]|nr:hypothetical protein [Bryobacteraceae bacterium]
MTLSPGEQARIMDDEEYRMAVAAYRLEARRMLKSRRRGGWTPGPRSFALKLVLIVLGAMLIATSAALLPKHF